MSKRNDKVTDQPNRLISHSGNNSVVPVLTKSVHQAISSDRSAATRALRAPAKASCRPAGRSQRLRGRGTHGSAWGSSGPSPSENRPFHWEHGNPTGPWQDRDRAQPTHFMKISWKLSRVWLTYLQAAYVLVTGADSEVVSKPLPRVSSVTLLRWSPFCVSVGLRTILSFHMARIARWGNI